MDFLVLKNDHNEFETLVERIACGQHFQLTTGRGVIKTIIIRIISTGTNQTCHLRAYVPGYQMHRIINCFSRLCLYTPLKDH